MNKGEIDENLAKLALIFWRDNNQFGIQKVGFGEVEYKSHGKSIEELRMLTKPQEIKELCDICKVEKATAIQKADVYINDVGWSLKSSRGAKSALLNHTHRGGIKKVCERIGLDIQKIDTLVDNYWVKRKAGEIKEDVAFMGSVFAKDKDAMVTLLEYFLFKGSAQGDSKFPANGLYEMTDPLDMQTWKKYDKIEAAKSIIDSTVISIRSKGIMESYCQTSQDVRHIVMHPWVELYQGKFRGSLHIRV